MVFLALSGTAPPQDDNVGTLKAAIQPLEQAPRGIVDGRENASTIFRSEPYNSNVGKLTS
jgi:hypothetical protein